MLFIPALNTAQYQLIYDVYGQRCQNVINIRQVGPPTAESMGAFCAILKDWFALSGKTVTSADARLALIVAKSLHAANGPAIEYNTGLPIVGTYPTGSNLPLNVTVAVKFSTALRGRSYRGRLYQIGLSSGQTLNNALTPEAQSQLVTVYSALKNVIGLADGWLSVVSRFSGLLQRTSAVVTDVNGVSVDANLDSQRRRLNGRGE